jgi:hypothetical protein
MNHSTSRQSRNPCAKADEILFINPTYLTRYVMVLPQPKVGHCSAYP